LGCVDPKLDKKIDLELNEYRGSDPDEFLCSNNDRLHGSCYRHLGSAKQNLDLCDKIQFGEDSQELCYADVAGKVGDIRICETLAAGVEKDRCYQKVAIALKDISICEKIQDMEYFQWLISPIYPSATSVKESCYASMAAELGELNICEKISDVYVKDGCFLAVAITMKDEEICNKMSDDEVIEKAIIGISDCYNSVAIAKNEIELCDNDGFYYSDCIKKIIENKKDLSLCEIIDSEGQNICTFSYAKITRDGELCKTFREARKKVVGCMLNFKSMLQIKTEIYLFVKMKIFVTDFMQGLMLMPRYAIKFKKKIAKLNVIKK